MVTDRHTLTEAAKYAADQEWKYAWERDRLSVILQTKSGQLLRSCSFPRAIFDESEMRLIEEQMAAETIMWLKALGPASD